MTTLHTMKRRRQRAVHMLIGPIASGKSTWVRNRLVLVPSTVVINDDALMLAVHGGNYSAYDRMLNPLYKSTENHILAMGIALGYDVIVDRPHMSVASRRRVLGLASSLDVPVYGHIFPFGDASVHAARRLHADSRGQDFDFWLGAATKQINEFESPLYSEGFSIIREED